MQIERETVVEIAVSLVTVVVFVAAVVFIGMSYGGPGEFSTDGALALVGAIVAFILLMFGVGFFLSGRS
jgi:hypothetical protein